MPLPTFLAALVALPLMDDGPRLRAVAAVDVPGAEVVSVDRRTATALVTTGDGVAVLSIEPGPRLRRIQQISAATLTAVPGEITHVAFDPVRAGVAAACLVPFGATPTPGLVVLFRGDALLATIEVGFHPDACAFSADGRFLVTCNEGEPGGIGDRSNDPPGSVSILDLVALRDAEALGDAEALRDAEALGDAEALRALDGTSAVTIYPSGSALHRDELRIHPARRGAPGLDLEPEYVAVHGGRAWISLQENNAVGVLDLVSRRFLTVRGLGRQPRRIDDRKDGRIDVSTPAWSMPMPDQLAVFESRGQTFVVTADEGDDREGRGELNDVIQVGALRRGGRLLKCVDNDTLDDNLSVCAFTGDDDGDGRIERPVTLGARSISVWNADTLELVGSTGSDLERAMARFPDVFNGSPKGKRMRVDHASTQRGPEPEGIVIARVDGRDLAFVTLERPGAVACVDLSVPSEPRVGDVLPIARDGHLGPEGIAYVAPEVTGERWPLLLVACEASGTVIAVALTRDEESPR